MSKAQKVEPMGISIELRRIVYEWGCKNLKDFKDAIQPDMIIDTGSDKVAFLWFKREKDK
jgi:hypothetical protein